VQQQALLRSVRQYFPGHRVTEPEGGYFVWLELPPGTDSLELHRRALEHGISIAPGPIFSPRREYRNCVRLNYGHPWSADLERAVRQVARLSAAL
jgi:DNA-binding transcriptional MocR family regulator